MQFYNYRRFQCPEQSEETPLGKTLNYKKTMNINDESYSNIVKKVG